MKYIIAEKLGGDTEGNTYLPPLCFVKLIGMVMSERERATGLPAPNDWPARPAIGEKFTSDSLEAMVAAKEDGMMQDLGILPLSAKSSVFIALKRNAARMRGDYAMADQLRQDLVEAGDYAGDAVSL